MVWKGLFILTALALASNQIASTVSISQGYVVNRSLWKARLTVGSHILLHKSLLQRSSEVK